MKHEKFMYQSLEELKAKIHELGLSNIHLSDEVDVLKTKIKVDELEFENRIAIQPMEGCDGTLDGKPDELTKRRYDRFAKSGAGLIWFEAVAVLNEGRANKRQLFINDKNLDSFKQLIFNIKETSFKNLGFVPKIIMQATHSGRYSKPNGYPEPIIAYNNPIFEKDNPINKSAIITDDKLKDLEIQYGIASKLAQDAGFDGIDIKCCHRYLASELLSAFTREGEYGGSFENRTRLIINGIKSAKANSKSGFMVTTRLNVYDGFEYPYGFGVNENDGLEEDLTEGIKLIDILHNSLKINLIDITIGNPYVNPHVNRPYDSGGYIPDEHPLCGVDRMYRCVGTVQKAFPELTVIGSGVSYLRQFAPNLAAGAINKGYQKIQGFGREAFAYPEFAKDILERGNMDTKKCCITCGKCTELMRHGTVTGCVIKDSEVYLPIYKEALNKN